jgi:hypothetical protein
VSRIEVHLVGCNLGYRRFSGEALPAPEDEHVSMFVPFYNVIIFHIRKFEVVAV